MSAYPRQLVALKAPLHTFADSTRLKVNYNKSSMLPINVSPKKMKILAGTLNCKFGTMLFTYLSLPLGLTRPNISDFLPFVQRIETRLVGCALLLIHAGKLEMATKVISSLPTFDMSTLNIPITAISQVDKYKMYGLLRGLDVNA